MGSPSPLRRSTSPATITRGTTSISFDHDPEQQRVSQTGPDGTILYNAGGGILAGRFAGTGSAVQCSNYLIVGGLLVGVRWSHDVKRARALDDIADERTVDRNAHAGSDHDLMACSGPDLQDLSRQGRGAGGCAPKADVAINEAERLLNDAKVDLLMDVYSSAHCVPMAAREGAKKAINH